MKKSIILLVWCLLSLSACLQKNKQQVETVQLPKSNPDMSKKHLSQLVQLMTGQFDSLKQSQEDSNYYHISLKMKPIWTARNDGYWLYVEQAVGTMLDKPYRQRVYHVTALDADTFSSSVYELPDAKAVVGGFENPALLVGISPEDLTIRTGCAVVLKMSGINQYSGSTGDKTCLSQLRGATYATSKVSITESAVSSWDQGFDDKDQQVWGAVEGPYVFDRK